MSRALSARRRLIAVLCGGFFGTLARYVLSGLIQAWLGKAWPYDILFINLTGALLLAFVTTLADATFLVGPTRRLFINVGFLGAYTTFSTFTLGTDVLLSGGQWLPALLYVLMSIIGGMAAVLFGDWLGQWLISKTRRPSPLTKTTRRLTAILPAFPSDHEGAESTPFRFK
jgi:protein CrcB